MSGHLELCGPPGVGKSTLMRALGGRRVELDGRRYRLLPGDRARTIARPGLRALEPVLTRPGVAALLSAVPWACDRILHADGSVTVSGDISADAAAIAREARPEEGDLRASPEYRAAAVGWTARTLDLARLAERLPDRLLMVLDEGGVQRTLSILGTRATEVDRLAVLARFPRPRAIVHLDAPIELLVRRALARREQGRGPRLQAGLTPDRLAQVLREDAEALGATVDLAAAEGIPVVRIAVDEHEHVRPLLGHVLRALARPGR